MECYLRHVTKKQTALSFDASVAHAFHIHAPLFLSFAQPQAKLIATVRDPLEILESHYFFSWANIHNISTFSCIIIDNIQRFVDCHMTSAWARQHRLAWDPACVWTYKSGERTFRGSHPLSDVLYADMLHLWLARFPPSQILWLDTNEILTIIGVGRVATFIGVQRDLLWMSTRPVNKNSNNSHNLFEHPLMDPNVTHLVRMVADPLKFLLEAARKRG